MPTTSDTPTVLEALRQAAVGVLMPSETDAPFEPFFWPNAKVEELTPERVAELAAAPAGARVEPVSLRSFFRNATKVEDWHNAEEAAQVERFRGLVKALKEQLADAKVFRIGETKMDCYVVGGVEGGCGGLKTQVVET